MAIRVRQYFKISQELLLTKPRAKTMDGAHVPRPLDRTRGLGPWAGPQYGEGP